MRRNVVRPCLIRKYRDKRYAVAEWSNRLLDVPAFILGNGPSLSDENLNIIRDYFTIGINRAFYCFDPTILLWQDISFWNTEFSKLDKLQAIKVARDAADPERKYYNFSLRTGAYHFDLKKTHVLYGSGSTGPLAIEFAVALGCAPIILLGMDCSLGADGRTDFYGNNKHWFPHTLDACNEGLKFVKEHCPVSIISCSSNKFWPRQALPQVIEQLPQFAWGREIYQKRILTGDA